MANIKSAIKRNKQNEKRRVSNRIVRGRARTFIKETRFAVQGNDQESAAKSAELAISALDKAAQKGVIHKNNAARRKSRLVKLLASLKK